MIWPLAENARPPHSNTDPEVQARRKEKDTRWNTVTTSNLGGLAEQRPS